MLHLERVKGAGAYAHLGITFAVTTVGMFFLGYWVDGRIGTTPLLAIIGAFVGATGGFIYLIQTLKKLQEENEQIEREAKQKDVGSGGSGPGARSRDNYGDDGQNGDQ